jgi:hypothetical protein
VDPGVGIIGTPGILLSSDQSKEFIETGGSTTRIGVTIGNPGPRSMGRQSWRQIR